MRIARSIIAFGGLLAACATGACSLETSGLDFFPDDAAGDVTAPAEGGVDAGKDARADASGAPTLTGLAAAATVCTSPKYRAVVTLGGGAADGHAITSPKYKVVGAAAGVSPK